MTFASDLQNCQCTLLQKAKHIPTFSEINKADWGKNIRRNIFLLPK